MSPILGPYPRKGSRDDYWGDISGHRGSALFAWGWPRNNVDTTEMPMSSTVLETPAYAE